MITPEQLSTALTDIASSVWQTTKRPVLLSNLPPLLLEKVPDYREMLGTQSLKQFIKESEAGQDYRLIQHPTQAAKLALLPQGASYEFVDSPRESDIPVIKSERNSEKALIDFLKALKKLPVADLANVQLPVSILVKLLK